MDFILSDFSTEKINSLSQQKQYPDVFYQDCSLISFKTKIPVTTNIYKKNRLLKQFKGRRKFCITDCFYLCISFIESDGILYQAKYLPCKLLHIKSDCILFYECCLKCMGNKERTVKVPFTVYNMKTDSAMIHYNINRSVINIFHIRYIYRGEKYFLPKCLFCASVFQSKTEITEHFRLYHPNFTIINERRRFQLNCCGNTKRDETEEVYVVEKVREVKFEQENFSYVKWNKVQIGGRKRVRWVETDLRIDFNHIFNLEFTVDLQKNYDERKFTDYVTFSSAEQMMMIRWNHIFRQEQERMDPNSGKIKEVVKKSLYTYRKKYEDWEEMVFILYAKGILTDKEIIEIVNLCN